MTAPEYRTPVSLPARVFLATAAVVALVLAAAVYVTTVSIRRAADEAARAGLDQAADLAAQFLSARERTLSGGARVFVQSPYFRSLVAGQRRDDILDQTFEATELLGADWVFITDGEGRLLAKSDEPGAAGGPMGNVPLIAAALGGHAASGFGVSRDSLLFQAVAVPVAVPGGAPVGVLVATRVVDSLLAHDVKAAAAGDVIFYALDRTGTPRVSAATLPDGPALDTLLGALVGPHGALGSARAPAAVRYGDAPYIAQGGGATTAGGEVVGGFVVLRAAGVGATEMLGVERAVAVGGTVGALLAMLLAVAAARRIVRPARALADAARRAAEGDYAGLSLGTDPSGDELGALGGAFRDMLADLRDRDALAACSVAPLPDEPVPDAGAAAPRLVRTGSRTNARVDPRTGPQTGLQTGPRAAAAAAPPLAGRYELQAIVGAGGTGVVYRALDRTLGETVAVKVLRPELLAADPAARERLAEELRLTRRVSHRNVVRTHDLGEADGVAFITMEYVAGPSLDALLRARGALPGAAVLGIGKQLARGLAAAHEQGVLHGDLKPANLLVGPGGVLKVTDFGVARLVRTAGAASVAGERAAGERATPQLAGAVLGTPQYMAPELLLGAAPDVRADLYAAGMVLRECMTGETPFDGDTPMAFLTHKLDEPAHAARPRGATPTAGIAGLGGLVDRMIAPDPAVRPASAVALYDALVRLG